MSNATNEKKHEWTGSGMAMVDRVVSDVKSINPEDVKRSAAEITSKVRSVSTEAYDDAVGYVRRNPVQAALGLCAFGFIAGFVSGMFRRSA